MKKRIVLLSILMMAMSLSVTGMAFAKVGAAIPVRDAAHVKMEAPPPVKNLTPPKAVRAKRALLKNIGKMK